MKIIGHRGARGLSPENTIAGIEKAIEHGVDEIELDARITKDGVAVLHHDPAVRDPSGQELTIRHATYTELLRHKPDLAALDMAIRVIAHRCPVIIEIKPGEDPKKIERIIRYYLAKGWRLHEFRVASFSLPILQYMHETFPHLPLIVNERWSSIRARYKCEKVGTKRVSMQQWWLWRGFLKAMKRSGYQISPYTVNNPKRARKWHPYIYGIITDRPDLFERKHTQKGHSHPASRVDN